MQTLKSLKTRHFSAKALIKTLGIVLVGILVVGFITTKQANAAVTLSPDPGPIPAADRNYLENADAQAQTPAFALWIAAAGSPATTNITVAPGSTTPVALEYYFSGAVGYKASTYDVSTKDRVIGASSSPTSSVTGIVGSTLSLSFNNTPGDFSNAIQDFSLNPPPGGFTAANAGQYTVSLTVQSINEFSDGVYQCVGGRQNYVNPPGFDFSQCDPVTVSAAINITVAQNTPTASLDSASCDPATGGIFGWTFDGNDTSQPLNVDVYVNGPAGSGAAGARYLADVARPDVDAAYGITGNHGFSIDPLTDSFLSTYANSGNAFTVYIYAIGINSLGAPDGNNPLIGTASITCPGGQTTGNLGSAACVTPPGFDPSRLPYDPGEQVGVTTSVTYTPPSGTSGGVPGESSYVSYQQGTPAPTVTLTSPTWSPDLGTSDVGAGTSLTTKFIVPNTPGPYNVNWTYNWTVLEITNTYHPAVTNAQNVTTPAYYTSTSTTVPQQHTCTWPGGTGPPTACIGGDSSSCTTTCPNGSSSCTTTCTGGGTACSTTCIDGSPTCLNVAYYPYFRAYGGDISAGGTCSGTPSASIGGGGIYGWPTLSSEYTNWNGGAGTQFGEDAAGVINGAASAANVATGSSNPPPTGLSFSNQSTAANSYIYGGCSGGADTPAHTAAYYDQVPTGTATFTSESLSDLTSGNYSSTTDVNITASSIGDSTDLKIYVKGNVEISGNIVFANDNTTGWSSTNKIPSVWIIASGNIAIDQGVTKLDGVYVAKGYINTCDVATSSAAFYSDCDKQLTVNGSFITGGDVYLDRTYGTVSQSTANESSTNSNAGEVFNYNPFLFLPTQTEVSPNYDAITSLPPVL